MAKCITPFYKKDQPGVPLPCGRCPPCCKRRASGWSFRLVKEGENFSLSYFVTLTYSTLHVPITEKGYMTLNKKDVQDFMKRLRKHSFIIKGGKKIHAHIKYYAVGEYGTHTMRPHYHIILFGADQASVCKAWDKGEVHFGTVEAASIGYTLKYISKQGRIPMHQNDDRIKEFSLMSKNWVRLIYRHGRSRGTLAI